MKSKIFALGLLCGALMTPEISLNAVWQPAEIVSDLTYPADTDGNALAVNFQGNAIAVWINEGNPVYGPFATAVVSSFYTRGIGWAPFEYVSSLAPGPFGILYGFVTGSDVDMNSSNYAVAVWEGDYRDGVFPLPIFAAVRPPGGPWGPVEFVSSPLDEFGNNVNPSVQVNEAGTALATWRVANNPGRLNATLVSFLPLGDAWSTPYAVSINETVRDLDNSPSGALNSRGDAVVSWFGGDDDTYELNVATYNAVTATWRFPVTLDAFPRTNNTVPFSNPVCSIDENGNAVVIWKFSPDSIKTSYYPFGGVWEPSVTLATNGLDDPYVIMDRAGNSTAVWDTDDGKIVSASRPLGDVWSVPVVISQGEDNRLITGERQQRDPVAVDLAGNVMVVWSAGSFGPTMSAFKPFGQAWQAPELVTARSSDALNVGLAECGFAIASWIGSLEGFRDIEAAVHENLFPLIVSGSANFTHCKLQFATQKTYISSLSWVPASPACISAYNIYCNGVLVATTTDTSLSIQSCDKVPCNFTISTVNVSGVESPQIPFILSN